MWQLSDLIDYVVYHVFFLIMVVLTQLQFIKSLLCAMFFFFVHSLDHSIPQSLLGSKWFYLVSVWSGTKFTNRNGFEIIHTIDYSLRLMTEKSKSVAYHGIPHPKQGCDTQIAPNCATVWSSHRVKFDQHRKRPPPMFRYELGHIWIWKGFEDLILNPIQPCGENGTVVAIFHHLFQVLSDSFQVGMSPSIRSLVWWLGRQSCEWI